MEKKEEKIRCSECKGRISPRKEKFIRKQNKDFGQSLTVWLCNQCLERIEIILKERRKR